MQFRFRRLVRHQAAILAALAIGAAVLPTGAASAQTLTLGTKLELNTLDPHFFAAFPTGSSHENLYEKLTFQDETGAIQPQLATGWRSIDPQTWELKLRPNVKFHDGSPFGADDVVFTFARVPEVPNSPNSFAQFTRGIERVEVLDPLTIRLHTRTPTPSLPLDLSNVFIVSSRAGKGATTADYNSGKAAVGTGPYKLVEWVNGERLVVERFEGHWAPKQPWQRVTERVIAKDASRVAALLSGQVDAIDLVPIADLPRLKQDARWTITSGAAAQVHYIALDSAREVSPFVTAKDGSPLAKNPLRDPRVRKALSLAIGRGAIAERLLEGSAVPASQLLPAGFPGVSTTLRPDPYDLPRAQALLKEAGWGDGFKITLHATGDRYPNDAGIAQAIGSGWTRLGLAVAVETMPGSVFFGRASKQEFSAFTAQYGADDIAGGMRAMLATTDPARGFGTANRTRYSNPAIDQQLSAALPMMDPAQRNAALSKVMEAYMADQGLIPVFYPVFDYATRKGLAVTHRPQRRFNALMIRPVP
jgi:peptide/nickel transport system substrate-binding protein